MSNILILLLLTISISSCSAINKMMYESKCNLGDWETLGYSDGKVGKSSGNIMSWNERCQPFNAKPNSKTYMQGVRRGILDYCKDQGLKNGRTGKYSSAPGQCLGSTNGKAFKAAYLSGIAEYCNYENGLKAGQSGLDKPKSCVKYSSFVNAYKLGLTEFCSEKKAYDSGVSGAESFNAKNCSVRVQAKLQQAFYDGKSVSGLKAKIRNLDSEIMSLEGKMYDVSIPADAKVHYRSILSEKKRVLRETERELFGKERR